MPRNRELTEEEERGVEEGGGLKERTVRDREKIFEDYCEYAESRLGKTIPEQFTEDPKVLGKNFTSYFWSMVVKAEVTVTLSHVNLSLLCRSQVTMDRQGW